MYKIFNKTNNQSQQWCSRVCVCVCVQVWCQCWLTSGPTMTWAIHCVPTSDKATGSLTLSPIGFSTRRVQWLRWGVHSSLTTSNSSSSEGCTQCTQSEPVQDLQSSSEAPVHLVQGGKLRPTVACWAFYVSDFTEIVSQLSSSCFASMFPVFTESFQ